MIKYDEWYERKERPLVKIGDLFSTSVFVLATLTHSLDL